MLFIAENAAAQSQETSVEHNPKQQNHCWDWQKQIVLY